MWNDPRFTELDALLGRIHQALGGYRRVGEEGSGVPFHATIGTVPSYGRTPAQRNLRDLTRALYAVAEQARVFPMPRLGWRIGQVTRRIAAGLEAESYGIELEEDTYDEKIHAFRARRVMRRALLNSGRALANVRGDLRQEIDARRFGVVGGHDPHQAGKLPAPTCTPAEKEQLPLTPPQKRRLERRRRAWALADEGCSQVKIADLLVVSEGTVSKWLRGPRPAATA